MKRLREFAEVVRPMHPLAHENPLAQWLPKTVEASFLLLHPVFDFPSGEHASADVCSSSAPSDKRSSIGSQEESVGSSASSRDDGPSLDHASNATSRSSPISMKSHEDGGRTAEEHIKMMDEKGETEEMDDTDEMDGTDSTDNTDDMDDTDGTDGADREDQTDGEDGAESASEVDDPESLSPGSESSASADGLNPIASQIHMLSDPTQRPMPLLGLLCMADVDNIFDVMASMLHQRRAWGLSNQPVVGLAFDQYQTSVQVVFGWFDDSDVSQPYCVPLPRVAYAAPGCTAREKGGIFDLAYPSSAEALATFLLGLRERIESISAECDARAEDVFAQVASGAVPFWRADGPVPVMDGDTIRSRAADEDEIGHEQGAWWRTISSWVEDVNAARCDRFAREKAIEIDNIEIHRIYLWMLDRNATSHSFLPTTVLQQASEDPWISSTEKHYETYENYTALYLPSAWAKNPPIKSLTSEEGAAFRTFLTGPERRENLELSQVEAAEPLTAKCDGLGVVCIEGFFKDIKRGWINSFALVSRPKPSKKKKTDDQQTEVNNAAGRDIDAPPLADKGNTQLSDSASATHGMFVKRGPIPPTAHSDVMFSAVFRTAAHIEPAPKLPGSSLRPPLSDVSTAQAVDTLADKLADTHIRASVGEAKAKQADAEGVEDASRTNPNDESDDGDPNQEAEDEVVLDEKESLEIPILIREYKKIVSLVEETAGNQARLDLVAVVKFLGVLGITDFPIFGIISEAAMGVVACAWGEKIPESKEIRVRIIDRNLRGFDLATVEGVFNYASFVAKLQKEHAPKLARLFKENAIRAKVLQDYATDSSEDTAPLRWNIYQKVQKINKNASSSESKGKQKA
ncbi:hypothetical protein DENSPDRAFT_881147 [Dentipellis sp. KUC8613]|nr:hypothetical protein DENSPDRAFT_881147 [Dentipellis sp. KUC8613]